MITTMLLGSWLAAGQAPAPMPMPMPKPMAAPMTAPMAAPAATAPAAECATCAAEPEAAATKYFVEKLLEGTRFGQTLADRGVRIYGWTQMNYTASSASKTNQPTTFNDRANEFQMNQTWLRIDKAVDTSKKEFQLGYHIDAFIGTDARFTVPRGMFDNQLRNGNNGGPRNYPSDIYAAYVEAFLPSVGPEGTTVRVGRFATHCSYEVGPGIENPFVSRSYGFQYNPFTHTGVWTITPLNETWTMSNGVAVGADNFIDPTNRLTYLGQLKWAPKDGDTQVLFNTVITNPRYNVREAFNIYNTYNLQIIRKLNEDLTYVLDGTYSHQDNFPGVGSANWYGVVNYLFWKHNDKFTSQFRYELFVDSQGIRTGSEGLYTEVTYGLKYQPKDWLMFQPFVRYDYNADGPAFEGRDRDLFTAGIEAIVRW